jgi:hypothetical protein
MRIKQARLLGEQANMARNVFVVMWTLLGLSLLIVSAAAQDNSPPTPLWVQEGVDRFTPTCNDGEGASLQIEGNALIYTLTPFGDEGNPWRIRFNWDDPVLGGDDGLAVTAHVTGIVEREGSPSSPTPSVRMFMFVDPPGYTVHNANVEFSGALGAGGSVGDDFEARANPDFTQPFDVVVWFAAHYCDHDNREVVRFHFRRTTPADTATQEPVVPGQLGSEALCAGWLQQYASLQTSQQTAALNVQRALEQIEASRQATDDAIRQIEEARTNNPTAEPPISFQQAAALALDHRRSAVRVAQAQGELARVQAELGAVAQSLEENGCPLEAVDETTPGDLEDVLVAESEGAPEAIICISTSWELAYLEEEEDSLNRWLPVWIGELGDIQAELRRQREDPEARENWMARLIYELSQRERTYITSIAHAQARLEVLRTRIGQNVQLLEDFDCPSSAP